MAKKNTTTVLELLPKGEFIITVSNGGQRIKGRFSMYVLDRFCDVKNISSYFLLLDKIISGMSVGDYAMLVHLAIDDYFRDKETGAGYSRAEIFDLIDDTLDGVASADFLALVRHAIGRVADLKKVDEAVKGAITETEEALAEKKSK